MEKKIIYQNLKYKQYQNIMRTYHNERYKKPLHFHVKYGNGTVKIHCQKLYIPSETVIT